MGSPSFSSRAVIAVLMPDLFQPRVLHAVRVTSAKGTENETGSWESKERGGAFEGGGGERIALSKLDRGEYAGGISKGEKGRREGRQESGERQCYLLGLKQFDDKERKGPAMFSQAPFSPPQASKQPGCYEKPRALSPKL